MATAQEADLLKEAYVQPEVDLQEGIDQPIVKPREKTTWWSQFVTLFRRTMMEQWRKKGLLVTNVFQTVVIALLIGATFYRIGRKQSTQSRRQPVLFFTVINQVRVLLAQMGQAALRAARQFAHNSRYMTVFFPSLISHPAGHLCVSANHQLLPL